MMVLNLVALALTFKRCGNMKSNDQKTATASTITSACDKEVENKDDRSSTKHNSPLRKKYNNDADDGDIGSAISNSTIETNLCSSRRYITITTSSSKSIITQKRPGDDIDPITIPDVPKIAMLLDDVNDNDDSARIASLPLLKKSTKIHDNASMTMRILADRRHKARRQKARTVLSQNFLQLSSGSKSQQQQQQQQ
mmetsp:Transcript_50642/g.56580  ORF Transcript_50642/g.56580 Transcript_50642/m.56580 type:complete len:196 (-) Transcript_50642:274-861(-)|eukprot:CAMPEP_0170860054 /NCGR_PEP_ID=MMETSP0734-20130129/17183_1 /TAXON_ID=186038 /ORGANISM="Fragilariopsis kerguelensis, Strain L26-C5" /LENGTH=195 /DNA_ID=CAMNT_0011233457 /DNA_START=26 /DNA_END=613 /DNA_ORIENTATION=+